MFLFSLLLNKRRKFFLCLFHINGKISIPNLMMTIFWLARGSFHLVFQRDNVSTSFQFFFLQCHHWWNGNFSRHILSQRHCLCHIRNTNLWKSFHSTAARSLQPPQNIFSTAGSQEYSSKQVGVTFGIVLAIIGPILGILAFIAYKLFDNNKKRRARGEYSPPSQQKMMSRPQPVRTPVPSTENLHNPDDE